MILENRREDSIHKTFYCIWVKTGFEEEYVRQVQENLDSPDSPLKGTLYFFQKKMRLKTGKEFFTPFFPGYVFFETDELTEENQSPLYEGQGFIRILPQNNDVHPLSENDLEIIRAILKFGTIIPIVHASFDVNDKIQLLDGPFKEIKAQVVAVNRRNKRVNIQVEFMNGMRLVGLTYEEAKKA